MTPMRSKAALYAFVLPACAFAGGACATLTSGTRHASGAALDTPYAAVEQMGRVLVEVENDYVDPVDRAKLVNGAIKGMVAELDPHSSYMTPEEFQLFESDTEGQFGGVGIEVETKDDQLIVLAPIEGSPAYRAGIKAGDVIVAVDGKGPERAGLLDNLVKTLRGAPGSRVKMTVRRKATPDPLVFDLVREVVRVPSVSSKLLAGGVAYVRIKQFQERTHDELLEAAARLRARAAGGSVAGVILDLRNDPGGLVDQATDVADEFLDDGVIYTARHRGQVVDEVRAHGGGAFVGKPVVALVNQWTASASELVAGALQDHGRARVVGEPTFGKGSVQAIMALPGGAGMRLTISRYYTPSGHAIQADGVHPDVAVETKKDEGASELREKDLQGHLAAESGGDTPKPRAVVVVEGDAGAVSIADDTGAEARHVPDDPAKGDDAVLKVGWQVLKQQIAR